MIFHGSIYHHEIPEFLEPYLETEAMQRLKLIDMNCGMNYTSYPRFRKIEAYSRFHHSLGCALIVWHFTHDRVQSLAALFHDIATPAFSHVVDFVYGDYENQETTEDRTSMMIRNDPGIMTQLKLDGIAPEAVSDYHLYPIADNASPRLCADRLEYILGDLSDFRMADDQTIQRLYNGIKVLINEDGQQELGFKDETTACEFAYYALECGKIYSGDENRFAMEQLAGIIRTAMKQRIITADDLYSSEAKVITKLKNSALRSRFEQFESCTKVVLTSASDEEAVCVSAKKRYVDPLCAGGKRISALRADLNTAIRDFVSLDYRYYVKGVIV